MGIEAKEEFVQSVKRLRTIRIVPHAGERHAGRVGRGCDRRSLIRRVGNWVAARKRMRYSHGSSAATFWPALRPQTIVPRIAQPHPG